MRTTKLHVGDFGDDVSNLHAKLKEHGLVVSSDETQRKFFGPSTRAAVWDFQKRQGIELNGKVDHETLALLETGSATASAINVAPADLFSTTTPPVATEDLQFVSGFGKQVGEFAGDKETLKITLEAKASTEVLFGPANPGGGLIGVDLQNTFMPRLQSVRRIDNLGGPGGGEMLREDVIARNKGGVGDSGAGIGTLDQKLFHIEVFPPGAPALAAGPGPLSFTVPPRVGSPSVTAAVNTHVAAAPKWKVRITNTTDIPVQGNVVAFYPGNRPILPKDVDLDALNHLLKQIIANSRPITAALENRTPETGPVKLTHTWLVLLPDQDWQRKFGIHEFDLGLKVIDKPDFHRVESDPMTMGVVVNDGRLALKAHIAFPATTILLKNLLDTVIGPFIPRPGTGGVFGALGAAVGALEDAIIDSLEGLVVDDKAQFRTLGADIWFTMADVSSFKNPSLDTPVNSCDVTIRPNLEMEGGANRLTILIASLIEGFCSHAYVFRSSFYDQLDGLRHTAELIWRTLGQYLLGRDKPALYRQEVPGGIRLMYAGDAPGLPTATTGENAPTGPLPDPGLLANVDHIVVLMMENRSFDHMLGHLSLPTALGGLGRTDVDGLRGDEFNLTNDNRRVYVFPFTRSPATLFGFDPGHSFHEQKVQRGGWELALPTSSDRPKLDPDLIDDDVPPTVTVPPMGGFVLAYDRHIHQKYTDAERADSERNYGSLGRDIMGYHLPASVPMYSFLAANALICDRWYAAHPGDTWPNRFITLTGNLAPKPPHDPHAGFPETGTPDLQNFTPVHVRNIFDHLTAANVTWRYYEHDMCMLRLFADYTLGHPNIVHIDDPVQGLEIAAGNGTLPSVVFIDPNLTDVPAGNDDHPPTDIASGQALVKRVYDALSKNKKLWARTMLVVTYDEYGGFYDHVLPPTFSDPADSRYVSPMFSDPEFPRSTPLGQIESQPVHYRGVRVPAFIVSPWVEPGSVSHLVFDHTSILKTIVTRFLRDNPPRLGERVDRANGLENVLSVPPGVFGDGGSGTVSAKQTPRAAATSPKLPSVSSVPRAIVAGEDPGDFHRLMSTVRDRLRVPVSG
jgi:phospholipase C